MNGCVKKKMVSIIVPVHNAELFLKETIDCVIYQSYTHWELLLINDCSTDNSKKIYDMYKDDKRIHWIDLNKNVGPALARNYGIELAKGDYICFLDADDKWKEYKLQKQIQFMDDKQCAFSYHSYEFADDRCVPNGKKVFAKDKLSYKQALKNTIVFTSTVMFDMARISKEEIKMPNLRYVEDTATWWRIMRNGYVAYGMTEILAYYRRSSNTDSSNKLKTQRPLWNLYRKEEKLSCFYSLYCLFWKNSHAILRRI